MVLAVGQLDPIRFGDDLSIRQSGRQSTPGHHAHPTHGRAVADDEALLPPAADASSLGIDAVHVTMVHERGDDLATGRVPAIATSLQSPADGSQPALRRKAGGAGR